MGDEFTGRTVSELKTDTLAKLRQKAGDYGRYSAANILTALDLAQVEAVRRSRCLKTFAIIELKDGYSQYKPPSQMMYATSAFFYQSSTSYYELEIKTRKWLDKYIPGWRVNNGDPRYMYPGDSYGNMTKLGFTPTPDTDGTSYTLDPDTGIYVSDTQNTISGNVTGVNTTAHATVCTDSEGRTLETEGVQVGMMATNDTDGSSGQISAVSGSTFTVTLTGGTSDSWAVGDNFTILAGEYGVVTSWESDTEHYIFGGKYGAMIDVAALTGNAYLEFIRRPLKLQFDTQYPELKPELHDYLTDYAEWWLKRRSPKQSEDFQDAQLAIQSFNSVFPPIRDESLEDAITTSTMGFNW